MQKAQFWTKHCQRVYLCFCESGENCITQRGETWESMSISDFMLSLNIHLGYLSE